MTLRALTGLLGMTAACWASGCASDGGDGGDGDADADGDADCTPTEDPPETPLRGQIRVRVDAEGAHIMAEFLTADPVALESEVASEGDCRLLEYEPGFCEDCLGICRSGECLPYPEGQAAGTVTVTGLGAPVRLDEYVGRYSAWVAGATLHAGAPIGVEGTGGDHPAFTIESAQPARLDFAPDDDELRLANGADATISWSPSSCDGTRVRLTLKTPTVEHGVPPRATIVCDAPDTGHITIPRALLEAFPETERREICDGYDCPPSVLARYTSATAGGGDDRTELVVESMRTFWLVHPAD